LQRSPKLARACALALGAALAIGGCPDPTVLQLQRRVQDLEQINKKQERQAADLSATLANLQSVRARMLGLPDNWREQTYFPVELRIEKLSGGEDYDDKPGDDGVTVYLRMLDRDGDSVKRAGDIRIELYDLANPEGRNRIGEYNISRAQSRELWFGKLMTYHYTIKCPWQDGPPAHAEITIRATFEDYVTKRRLTAQETRTVDLPPK
jgi:hypothetical protein